MNAWCDHIVMAESLRMLRRALIVHAGRTIEIRQTRAHDGTSHYIAASGGRFSHDEGGWR
jgi:hypothetical protein